MNECINSTNMYVVSFYFFLLFMFLGPLSTTIVDHWQMIWQEDVCTIVMVTKLKEKKKVKCRQYWPDNDYQDFGPFRITLSDQQVFANFTIRLLQLEVSDNCTLH